MSLPFSYIKDLLYVYSHSKLKALNSMTQPSNHFKRIPVHYSTLNRDLFSD
jgi:hypothetical protein